MFLVPSAFFSPRFAPVRLTPGPLSLLPKKTKQKTELESFGIRLNKKPPNITFKKKERGGINFTVNPAVREPKVDAEAVKAVLAEYRVRVCFLFSTPGHSHTALCTDGALVTY